MALFIVQDKHDQRRVPLFKSITRIGADPNCDLVLQGEAVAREHAQVLRQDDAFVLTSLGRGRVILINGKKEKRARLRQGDTVVIGDTTLTFVRDAVRDATHDVILQATTPPSAPTSHPSEARVDAYRELVAFSEKLLRRGDLDGLLTCLMDAVIDLSRADRGFLILFEQGDPVVKVARNVAHEDVDNALGAFSDSIVTKVVREQKPVIVSDALNDTEFSASKSVMSLHLCSVMCVPLREGGELFGLIYLGSNTVVNLFETATLDAVTVFASMASLLIRNAMLLTSLRSDNEALRRAYEEQAFGTIIGTSSAMRDVYRKVRRVAPTDISVLISGETGTGKELIAREIHQRSDRAKHAFVVVNCGAIPENLLEAELFGHVRGAFTGAVQTRQGRFQAADGGTLFLDEIGELPLPLQVKLLRALQEKVVQKIGDTKSQTVDIRVLAATNRDLAALSKDGAFREDLYYRLNVVGIHLPPLRERNEDLLLVARYLLRRFTAQYPTSARDFSPQCVMSMKKYSWPGNVRELENRIKKAAIMADHVQLTPRDLELDDADVTPVLPLNLAKEDFQRRYINDVLARNNGNRTKTARELGVDPRTIFRHLERVDKETGTNED